MEGGLTLSCAWPQGSPAEPSDPRWASWTPSTPSACPRASPPTAASTCSGQFPVWPFRIKALLFSESPSCLGFSHALESYTALPYDQRSPCPPNPISRPAYQGSNPISDVWSRHALKVVAKYMKR